MQVPGPMYFLELWFELALVMTLKIISPTVSQRSEERANFRYELTFLN